MSCPTSSDLIVLSNGWGLGIGLWASKHLIELTCHYQAIVESLIDCIVHTAYSVIYSLWCTVLSVKRKDEDKKKKIH